VGFATDPKNEPTSANARVLVRLNNATKFSRYNNPSGV
jgi:hypothetical protein